MVLYWELAKVKGRYLIMYEICINEELRQNIYEKLIEYSITKSDVFMLVTYRYSEEIEKIYSVPDEASFDNKEIYLKVLDSFKRMKKEEYRNRTIFKKNTESFLEKLKPYLIKKRNLPTEWPGLKVILDKHTKVDICVYRIYDEAKNTLLEPKGLFNWRYPYFPENLCFFKDNYCWFYSIAHEEYAYIYIKSLEEVKELENLGLNFKARRCKEDEIKLFYEDYSYER